MRKSSFTLAVLLASITVGLFVFMPREESHKKEARPGKAADGNNGVAPASDQPATKTAATEPVEASQPPPNSNQQGTNAAVPPLQTPSAVRNADGLVTSEIADLGDGRGPVARRFRYDKNGNLTGEVRSNATTGQLIETLEYLRSDDGKLSTRITDPAGNITFVTPEGGIVAPDGTRID